MVTGTSTSVPFGRDASGENLLRIACRAASIGVWQWNLLTDEMAYTGIAREICGFPADGPVTREMVQAVTHPDDIERTRAQARRALDPSVREQGEFRYRIIRADNGAVRWVKAYGEAQFDVIGKDLRAVHFIGSIQDITEEKEREDAFAENADRLRLAIDAGKMAVWEVDFETAEVSGSAELNRLYRLPEDSKPTLDELRACYAPGERRQLLEDVTAPYRSPGHDQFAFEGPDVVVGDRVRNLAIAFHELATNGADEPRRHCRGLYPGAIAGHGRPVDGRPEHSVFSEYGLLTREEIASLEAAGAVGDLLCHFIDAEGNVIDHPVGLLRRN